MNATRQARSRGCLLGGAIGDALGAAVELLNREQIAARFGPGGIRDYALIHGRLGAITDDTQMTLFTADGMLRAHVRAASRTPAPLELGRVMSGAYQRWLRAIGLSNAVNAAEAPGWLIGHDELHQHRAPGRTCVPALQVQAFPGAPAQNESKGCGAVMRAAPVGLYFAALGGVDPEAVFAAAVETAALTHGHPSAQLPAGFLAVVIAQLTGGVPLDAAIAAAKPALRRHAGHDETLQRIELAEKLAAEGAPQAEAVDRLGPGWAGHEALAVGLYCALVGSDFESALVLAVNHAGDSDSTGSITGNLLGARDGEAVLPPRWLAALELGDVIGAIADDLAAVGDWALDRDPAARAFYQDRYPGA